MFNVLAKKRLGDQLLYEQVANEVKNNIKIEGIWLKAMSDSEGDIEKAKSLYVKYRVQSLKDIEAISNELESKKRQSSKTNNEPNKNIVTSIYKSNATYTAKKYNCPSCKEVNKFEILKDNKLVQFILIWWIASIPSLLVGITLKTIFNLSEDVYNLIFTVLSVVSMILIYNFHFKTKPQKYKCPSCGNTITAKRD
jgi:predicted RNA-binding Zn-ribbon protein involved in translation (DUF1610 family)